MTTFFEFSDSAQVVDCPACSNPPKANAWQGSVPGATGRTICESCKIFSCFSSDSLSVVSGLSSTPVTSCVWLAPGSTSPLLETVSFSQVRSSCDRLMGAETSLGGVSTADRKLSALTAIALMFLVGDVLLGGRVSELADILPHDPSHSRPSSRHRWQVGSVSSQLSRRSLCFHSSGIDSRAQQ